MCPCSFWTKRHDNLFIYDDDDDDGVARWVIFCRIKIHCLWRLVSSMYRVHYVSEKRGVKLFVITSATVNQFLKILSLWKQQ